MRIRSKLLALGFIPILFTGGVSIVGLAILARGALVTQRYVSEFVHREELLLKIERSLGYGGGIHAFKNYVIRREDRYRTKALSRIDEGLYLVALYLKEEGIGEIEKKAMQVLSSTFVDYRSKLEEAMKLISEEKEIDVIDRAVKVDDTEALAAMDQLFVYLEGRRVEEEKYLSEVLFWTLVFLVLTFLGAVSGAYFFGTKVANEIVLSLQRLQIFSKRLSRGNFDATPNGKLTEGENKSEGECEGDEEDEIQGLEDQFKKMSQSLRDVFERLKESNADLEHFASIASHDLQEPVKKIAMFSHLLQLDYGEQLGEGGRRILQKISDNSSYMSGLIHTLLEYSRLGNTEVEFEKVDLMLLVRQVIESFDGEIRARAIQIELRELPQVRGNAVFLKRLIQNLVSNAIKYSRSDHPRVSLFSSSLPNGKWKITVQDNGIGFDESMIPKILKPFGRAHSTQDYEGVGIGLAACRRILAAHDSQFEIESSEGEGASFSFVLAGAQTSSVS